MAGKFRTIFMGLSVAVTALAALAPVAVAQTAAGKQASATTVSTGPAPIRNSWICLAGMRLEVMPVSHDVSDAPEEWVLVYKQNGNPISAQKVSASEARSIPTIDCSEKSRAGATLVG